jgi:hypothetical protein
MLSDEQHELLDELESKVFQLIKEYEKKGLESYQVAMPMMIPVVAHLLGTLPNIPCAMRTINVIVNAGTERYQEIMASVKEEEEEKKSSFWGPISRFWNS